MKKVNRLRKKMEQNKKYFIPSLVLLAAMGSGIYGINRVSAQTNDGQAAIAERIASRFNLNKDEVQKVFEEGRGERQKNRQENFAKSLSLAVTRGELTEAQKNLIMDKKTELEKRRDTIRGDREKNWENLKNMTAEERQAAMEKRRSEMKAQQEEITAWAKANGIDVKYLMGAGRGRDGGARSFHADRR